MKVWFVLQVTVHRFMTTNTEFIIIMPHDIYQQQSSVANILTTCNQRSEKVPSLKVTMLKKAV